MAAPKHMSCPVSCAPPTPRHTPSTTRTPANPIPMPAARARVIRSVRNTSAASGSATSGSAAFQMPASTEDTRCSPKPNSVNGAETPSVGTTIRWAQIFGSRGSRSRVTVSRITRVAAPVATRPNVSQSGCSSRTPTLMHRKLVPQMAATSRNAGNHARRCDRALSGPMGVVTRDTLPQGYDNFARFSDPALAGTTEPDDLAGATPGQRHAGAAMPVRVHDGPARDGLGCHAGAAAPERPQPDLLPHDRRVGELRHQRAAAGQDGVAGRRVRRGGPDVLLERAAKHHVPATRVHVRAGLALGTDRRLDAGVRDQHDLAAGRVDGGIGGEFTGGESGRVHHDRGHLERLLETADPAPDQADLVAEPRKVR